MITEKDLYIASCGVDEKGITKALVKVDTNLISNDSERSETLDSIILDNPVINMIKTRSFTMIDLTFSTGDDYEFIKTTEILSDFCRVENSMDEEKVEMPAICISVCPRIYNGEYVIVGMHAMWALHQSKAGKGIDTIRFIIENGFMHTYQINVDEANMEKILDEADLEIAEGIY